MQALIAWGTRDGRAWAWQWSAEDAVSAYAQQILFFQSSAKSWSASVFWWFFCSFVIIVCGIMIALATARDRLTAARLRDCFAPRSAGSGQHRRDDFASA